MRRLITLLAVIGILGSLVLARSATAAPTPWTPGTFYAVGAQVTYQAGTYEAIQGHTAQVGWEPPAVPALWKSVPGTPATATPTVRPTNTPLPGTVTATPRPTNTATPRPTNTPTTGCTAPAWQSGTVYTQGNTVSHNGRTWRAKWWTQGEQPGVTSSGVWEDLGPCGPQPTATPTVRPTNTATPRPTNTPGPTPTIGPTATPCGTCGGGLPSKIVVGYWHNFDNGSGVIRLRDVSPKYDVINIAFAEPTVPNGSTMAFVPFGTTPAEFKADVAWLKSQGKKVLISIGGANAVVDISSAAGKQNYVNSLKAIIAEYGFNGMDVDLEHGISLNGAEDFRNPTSPQIVNLIAGSREIANSFGSDFILTMAPETAYVQGGYANYGGIWGGYLPLIYGLRDKLTYIHVQHYNTGSIEALDGRAYSQGTADFQVAMSEMLLQGFPVGRNANNVFPALRPDQVAIGLPASPSGASGGYTTPANVQKALDYLYKGQSFGGTYVLRKPGGYPQFRGVMTWSINWDRVNGYEFANNHRAYLNNLP
ncbi:MAG TPA: carbohydrate-binding protein [Herpetosiphonaceae bacterium]